MTFKHIKFADSSVMRSLERLAKEKGLVKEDVITKKASSKLDLDPSLSLTENIMKLCSGLRQSGFSNYASELETKFINYKQAVSLYETSSEKGEDLVDAAHPKGSHKLKDVDGDSVFETILDQHLKIMEKIDKVPTGKLSTANSIISAVKNVFAQSATDYLQLAQRSISSVLQISEQGDLSDSKLSSVRTEVNNIIKVTSMQDPTIDAMRDSVGSVNKLSNMLSPSLITKLRQYAPEDPIAKYLGSGLDTSIWPKVEELLNQTKTFINQAIDAKAATFGKPIPEPIQTIKEVTISPSPLNDRAVQLLRQLKAFKAIAAVAKNRTASDWVQQETAEIQEIMKRISSLSDEEEATVFSSLEKEIAEKEAEVNQFNRDWIQGRK